MESNAVIDEAIDALSRNGTGLPPPPSNDDDDNDNNKPEKLPEPLLGYYLHLRAEHDQVANMKEQAQRLLSQAASIEAALQSFVGYLPKLGYTEQQAIDRDGSIINTK